MTHRLWAYSHHGHGGHGWSSRTWGVTQGQSYCTRPLQHPLEKASQKCLTHDFLHPATEQGRGPLNPSYCYPGPCKQAAEDAQLGPLASTPMNSASTWEMSTRDSCRTTTGPGKQWSHILELSKASSAPPGHGPGPRRGRARKGERLLDQAVMTSGFQFRHLA